jgi:acetyl esterase/lipase
MPNPYHPDLATARWIPPFSYGPRVARLMRRINPRPTDPGKGVAVEEVSVSSTVSLRLYRPEGEQGNLPVLLWMHGGGHLFGSPEQDQRSHAAFVRDLGIAVAAARYRLGADAPAPASVLDCYAALAHLVTHADQLAVDPTRLAVGGASAGGGVAAGLVLYAHDRADYDIAFQLLVYPMLDDRTVTRTDLSRVPVRMWTTKSNRVGWSTYLGSEPGTSEVSEYAAPSRRTDLSGLPPTWIGVGELDLFTTRTSTTRRACALPVSTASWRSFLAPSTVLTSFTGTHPSGSGSGTVSPGPYEAGWGTAAAAIDGRPRDNGSR